MPARTLKTSYWTDPKIRRLSADAKYLGAYLIATPHGHICGVYYVTDETIAGDTGLPLERVVGARLALVNAGFVEHDVDTSELWVVKMFAHQPGAHSQTVHKSVAKYLTTNIHSVELVRNFLVRYQLSIPPEADIDGVGKTFQTLLDELSITHRGDIGDDIGNHIGDSPDPDTDKKSRRKRKSKAHTPDANGQPDKSPDKSSGVTPRVASTGYRPNKLVKAFAAGAGDMFALGYVEKGIAVRLNTLQAQAEKFGVSYDEIEAAGRHVLEHEHWRTDPVVASQLAKGNFLFDLLAKANAAPVTRKKKSRAQQIAEMADDARARGNQ